MKKLILATAITQNYFAKAKQYFDSIEKYSNFDENIAIGVDFNIQLITEKIKFCFLSNEKIENKNSINCIQHGDFLKSDFFNQLDDSDYICFTDADIVMQRPLSDQEIEKILSLKTDDVFVQYNNGYKDNLYDEFIRLDPAVTINRDFEKLPCYNTGIIICNISTWKKIEKLYSFLYPVTCNIARHYALQQWLLCYIINTNMNPIIMDYSFHTHHHYGKINGNCMKDNVLYHNDDIVLFAHHVEGIHI